MKRRVIEADHLIDLVNRLCRAAMLTQIAARSLPL